MNKISNAVDALLGAITMERDAQAKASSVFSILAEHQRLIKVPESFANKFDMDDFKQSVEILISQELPELGNFERFFYQHLLLNWENIQWQLRAAFENTEGSACCFDKARFVLNEYRKHLIGAELGDWNNQQFWVPNRNTPEIWFDFIKGIAHLECGQFQKFFESSLPIFAETQLNPK